MGGEKKVVQVEEEKAGLTFTDEKGSTHEYQQPIRTFYVDVKSLALCSDFNEYNGEAMTQPTMTRFIRGSGVIEDGYFSVIGDPDNRTNNIALNIRPRTAEDHAWAVDIHGLRQTKAQEESNAVVRRSILGSKVGGYFDAILGFTASNWAIGNDDKWWLQLDVSQKIVDDLATAIQRNEVIDFKLGLDLSGAYTDNYYAPPSRRANWFLRPSAHDGDARSPEVAYGKINVINVTYAKAEVAAPREPEFQIAAQKPVDDDNLAAHRKMAVLPKGSAGLEIASRLLKVLQTIGWIMIGVSYALGAYSLYLLWTVDNTSSDMSRNILNQLELGWIAIALIMSIRLIQIAVGWGIAVPIEARIQGINLREPEIADELRSRSRTLLLLEAIWLVVIVAVPLLIAHFKFGYFS